MVVKASFLVVHKEAGITSHDVVAAVRAVTGVKKVGHTGTLDPFATGVLPLALGGATRLIQYLDESIKVYDATIRLGASTDTGDPTGQVIREAPLPDADEAKVREVLAGFIGEQMQEPPAYSAVKVDGKPLYHYARKGVEKRASPRKIQIMDLQLVDYDRQTLRVLLTCSRGTYARVLADDIATTLQSAGHLVALSRPRSGPFFLEDAIEMQTLADLVALEPGQPWKDVLMSRGDKSKRVKWKPRDDVREALTPWLRTPVRCLSHLPLMDIGPVDARRIKNGALPPTPPSGVSMGGRFLLVAGQDVVAVAEKTPRGPKTLKAF
jgi:tRNA pseudouridine55 synthase